jgi:eukaryotic-like serine/threonine-protein kinase
MTEDEPPGRPESLAMGDYELLARIGSGGSATVLLAQEGEKQRLVVLKLLPTIVDDDEGTVEMFLDEGRIAARLCHPNIVTTHEVGESDGVHFIAMEYLSGQSLDRIFKSHEAMSGLTSNMWCHIFARALDGLHQAHQEADADGTPLGLVHRDVCPRNIFVTYDGGVKVMDFGVAKASVNESETAAGVIKGSLAYMSPEQVAGEPDRRSDIFAVGLCLWEALAGRPAFQGEPFAILRRIVNDPMPGLADARPGVDSRLDAIVMKAVNKDAQTRYQTAAEMADALRAFVASTTGVVTDEILADTLSPAFSKTKAVVAKAIAFLVAGAAKARKNGAKTRTPKMDGQRLQAELPTLPTTGGLFAPIDPATDEESTPALVETKPAEESVTTPLTTAEHGKPTSASASAAPPRPTNLKIVVAILVVVLVVASVWAWSR